MAAAPDLQALLAQLRTPSERRELREWRGDGQAPAEPPFLTLSWPGLDAVLPDGGLPRGVVELSAPRALGGSTSVALAAVRAGQARAARAWCAWIDPEGTLHAPGVDAAGVDLTRLLVARPPREDLGRIATKMARSGAFEVLVVDVDAVPGAAPSRAKKPGEQPGGRPGGASARRGPPPEVMVRKLALATEPTGTTVLLLTDSTRPRTVPWTVALRLELSRPARGDLQVRVAKDRRGRIGVVRTVPFRPVLRAAG
jgi:recombination protein RecA